MSLPELSTDLSCDDAQPYFIWDVPVRMSELRQKLSDPDPKIRALWMARVMREARYADVWQLIPINDVVEHLPLIRRHLGRSRPFWDFLLEGWKSDGLLERPAE